MSICLKVKSKNDPKDVFREVDIDATTRVTVSYAVTDFLKLNNPQSFKSTRINIAGTPKSNDALRSAFRVDIIDRSLIGEELDARLEFNNLDILKGTGKLTVAQVNYDIEQGYWVYDCYLIGTRFNWIKQLQNVNICDLDFGKHDKTKGEIEASWFFGPGSTNPRPYVYVPIKYGFWEYEILRETVNPAALAQIVPTELLPSCYVHEIITRLFENHTNFTIDSDFFLTEQFRRLIIPYTAKDFNISTGTRAAISIDTRPLEGVGDQILGANVPGDSAKVIFRSNPSAPLHAPSNVWNGTDYKVKFGVKYRVEFYLNSRHEGYHTNNAAEPTIILNQAATVNCPTGASYDRNSPEVSENQQISTPVPGPNTEWDERIVWELCLCEDDDIYNLSVMIYYSGTGAIGLRIFNDTALRITPITTNPVECLDTNINAASFLPCISGKKLLDGLTHMFNLVWDTDELSKTVYVEPDPNYYHPYNHVDWSSKVNQSRPITQKIGKKSDLRNYLFTYKQDSNDIYLVAKEEVEAVSPFSEELIINPNSAEDIADSENPTFAPSLSYAIETDLQGTGARPGVTFIRMAKTTVLDQDSVKTYDFEPRILYYGGTADYTEVYGNDPLDQPTWVWDGVDTNGGWPHAWFVNNISPRYNPSLAFNDNASENLSSIAPYSGSDQGLLSSYWEEYRKAASVGSIIQAELFLTESEVNSLTFQNKVYLNLKYIGPGIYRLNKIREWDIEDRRALCEFILTLDNV